MHLPNWVAGLGIALAVIVAAPAVGDLPQGDPLDFDLHPSHGLTEQAMLSDYHAPLADTPADTPVFIYEGEEPGGTLVVLGGTHGPEVSGIVAAILLTENLTPRQGTVIVIPYANPLNIDTDLTLDYEVPGGTRSIYYGQRRSLLSHYADEDPTQFEFAAGNTREGNERRNLNRVWPGRENGGPTEQIAYGIVQVLALHGADVAFDLHEAGGGSTGDLVWGLFGRPEFEDIIRAANDGVNARLELDLWKPDIRPSSTGLSFNEWPLAVGTMGFLTETPRGTFTPLRTRVAHQILNVEEVVNAFNDRAEPDRHIRFDSGMTLEQLTQWGLEYFLRPSSR